MNRLIRQRSDKLHVKFTRHCHNATFCGVNRQTYAPVHKQHDRVRIVAGLRFYNSSYIYIAPKDDH